MPHLGSGCIFEYSSMKITQLPIETSIQKFDWQLRFSLMETPYLYALKST